MQTSQHRETPHGNVEVLGFTPVARPDVEVAPSPDLSGVELMLAAQHLKTIDLLKTDLPKFIQQLSDATVKQTLTSQHLGVVGAFHAIGTILAVRFILLLSLLGAFALAWTAMANPTTLSVVILVSYVLLTVIPLVWLDRGGRRSTTQ